MNFISIQKLSDSDLILGTKSAVSNEVNATVAVLEFLKEVDRRKLYAEHDCSTIWEFCVKVLKYFNGSASRRVTSMKLLRDVPTLKEDLESGALNLSSLVQAQNFFEIEEKYSGERISTDDKAEILSRMKGKSTRECELDLIRMSSAPIEITRPEKERVINDEFTEWRLTLGSELLEKLDRIRNARAAMKIFGAA
jgi:hypothetical protein